MARRKEGGPGLPSTEIELANLGPTNLHQPSTDLAPGEPDPQTFEGFIEFHFNQFKAAPSRDRLAYEFPAYDEQRIEKQTEVALKKLEVKGYDVKKVDYLSPQQLAVANAMLNLADRRSDKKKLEDFKVSPAIYANWKKQDKFNRYLRERAEEVLGNSIGEVHLALIDSATSGDIGAMKLFYDITGRHSPGSKQVENVRGMLVRVIEAVQRHVKDPAVLQAIATEIQLATSEVISGESHEST